MRLAGTAAVSLAALAVASGASAEVAAVNKGDAWRIVKTEWSQADEDGYSEFVQAIGRSTCSSLESCLAVSANPYFDPTDPEFTGDCADMAYVLRAYYAWKNGLPFSDQNAMRTADGAREDLRYSSNGNVVAARRDAVSDNPVSASAYIGRIGGEVSTAMFRTHPDNGEGALHDDFYPVKIDRDAVRPGVLAYDIYGHVGVVFDILDDGRILVIASHPDRSVTRTTYGANFLRSKPDLGAGLKGWRPIRLEGARLHADGTYGGGRIRACRCGDRDDQTFRRTGCAGGHTQEGRPSQIRLEHSRTSGHIGPGAQLHDPGLPAQPLLLQQPGSVSRRLVSKTRTGGRVNRSGLEVHPGRVPRDHSQAGRRRLHAQRRDRLPLQASHRPGRQRHGLRLSAEEPRRRHSDLARSSPLRSGLHRARHRAQADEALSPVDQRPSRTDEPHHQGRHGQGHYPSLASLKAHILAFVAAYNFGKHLKALRWQTPFEAICHAWTALIRAAAGRPVVRVSEEEA